MDESAFCWFQVTTSTHLLSILDKYLALLCSPKDTTVLVFTEFLPIA